MMAGRARFASACEPLPEGDEPLPWPSNGKPPTEMSHEELVAAVRELLAWKARVERIAPELVRNLPPLDLNRGRHV